MILQSLVKYYDALVDRGDNVDEIGLSSIEVHWGLEIDSDGKIIDVLPINRTVRRIPYRLRKSSEKKSCFLCDDRRYVLGVPNSESQKDITYSEAAFKASVELYNEILGSCDSDFAKAIVNYFNNYEQNKQSNSEKTESIKPNENITFFFDNKWCFDDEDIIKAWNVYFANMNDGDECRCMISGEFDKVCRIHPSFSIPGGTNPKLVSFDKETTSFYSYGTDGLQAACIPIGTTTVMKYGNALRWLLSSDKNSVSFADGKIVFWVDDASHEKEQLVFDSIYGESNDPEKNIKETLEKILNGERFRFDEAIEDVNGSLYMVFLAAAKGRIAVRSSTVTSYIDAIKNIKQHYDDIEIVPDNRNKFKTIPLWKLLDETVRKSNNKDDNKGKKNKKTDSDKKTSNSKVLPQLSGDLLKAIITGGRYPETLINQVFIRIRAQKDITRGKAAIIKAYLIRNAKNTQDYNKISEVTTMALNEQSNYTPYVLGRLFSVLEEIQQKANPKINATIKDRYFNSASATPSAIFPILMKLANSHLRKLDTGSRIYLSKKLTELTDKLEMNFPNTLSLKEQGTFILGYYHQTQKRFEGKDKNTNINTTEENKDE